MGNLRTISLFSGVGGLDLAGKWCGVKTVCYCENDRYAQGVLMSRMRSGNLDAGPVWDDVATFDGKAWRGVEIVSGGFPCQDVSFAGKRAGLKPGTRSGLWNHFARIVREVRPRFVLVENVPGLLSLGFGRVLGDLAKMGMDAKWGVWGAADVGAPHRRNRVWVAAYARDQGPSCSRSRTQSKKSKLIIGNSDPKKDVAHSEREQNNSERGSFKLGRNSMGRKEQAAQCEGATDSNSPDGCGETVADSQGKTEGRLSSGKKKKIPESRIRSQNEICDSASQGFQNRVKEKIQQAQAHKEPGRSDWWTVEPDVGRVAGRTSFRVDRLRCLGNIVVPQQALPAWEEILRLSGS